jgi:hypothetical protein
MLDATAAIKRAIHDRTSDGYRQINCSVLIKFS